MNTPLKLLLCEDYEPDALLIVRQLELNGYDVDWCQVDNVDDLRCALEKNEYELVISDFSIPGFGGEAALEMVRQTCPDIPFILVSGAVGEETAVSMMKAGASDYLMKNSLFRLSETVKRELKEAAMRKEHRESVELLKANEAKYRAFIDQSMMAILLAPRDGFIQESNRAASKLFGYTREEFKQLRRDQLLDLTGVYAMGKLAERNAKGSTRGELTGLKKNGERFYCEVSSVIFKDINGQDIASAMISDITDRKVAEQNLKKTNKELKELSHHLKNAREDERCFIAREVHDQLGQLATALKNDVDWLVMKVGDTSPMTIQRIEHIETAVDTLLTSIRQIAANLRPSVLDDFGLNVAIELYCDDFVKNNNIETLLVTELDDSILSINQKTELYRIVQEAFTNILRHAKAKSVEIRLSDNEQEIFMNVSDNGEGFNTTAARKSLGLVGIRERAASLNGTMKIQSAPGQGTCLSIVIPKTYCYENSAC